jgi:hyperosmotically inducible protein
MQINSNHKHLLSAGFASLLALTAWAADKPAPDADNTSRNVRDRNENTATPLNQGNSKADIETTARIRKEIVADKSLSVNAHNAKVITMNGQVVLRGPVASVDEKRQLGEIAARIAQPEHVTNQLEVQTSSAANAKE